MLTTFGDMHNGEKISSHIFNFLKNISRKFLDFSISNQGFEFHKINDLEIVIKKIIQLQIQNFYDPIVVCDMKKLRPIHHNLFFEKTDCSRWLFTTDHPALYIRLYKLGTEADDWNLII